MTETSSYTNLDWQHTKVLIIDDQLSSALLIQNILYSIDLTTVDIATNSLNALQLCKTTAYDLILIDFHLDPHISGSELITVMRKNNYINSYCGLIFISADRTPEVIVTSISLDADSFLSKPLNIGQLKQRIIMVYQACLVRKPIYIAISNNQTSTAIVLCRQLLQQHGHNLEIEILLVDLLISQQDWLSAQQLLTLFSKRSQHHKLGLRQAQLTYQQDDALTAISMLQTLIKQVPLFVEAYDELALLLYQQQHLNEAKAIAYQALKLTPSISQRSLMAAKLAVCTNDPSLFFKIGKIFVTHLPLIDQDWITYFAQFTALFEQLYSQQLSPPQQRKQLRQLKKIHQLAQQRLTLSQKTHLTAFCHIVLARFAAINNQPLKAKHRLLHGLKIYFDQMSQVPMAIIVDALPLLIHFGESRLIKEAYQRIKTQSVLDEHCHHRLNQLQENKFITENMRLLVDQLATAKIAIDTEPQCAYSIYQTILRDYPYNTEAHLGRINSLLMLQQIHDPEINISLRQVKKTPLTSPLLTWFSLLQKKLKDQQHVIYN